MILLRYQFLEGDVRAYDVEIDSQKTILNHPDLKLIGKEERETFQMKVTQQLRALNPDGTFLIRATTMALRHFRAGEEEPIPNIPRVVDIVMSPVGDILWSSFPTGIDQPAYPSGPLEVGDCWPIQAKFVSPFAPQPLILSVVYELQGVETVHAIPCARIAITSPGEQFDLANDVVQRIRVEGTSFFDYEKGALIKSDTSHSITVENPDERVTNIIRTLVSKD